MKHILLLVFSILTVALTGQEKKNTQIPLGFIQLKKSTKNKAFVEVLDSSKAKIALKIDKQIIHNGMPCFEQSNLFYKINFENRDYYIPKNDSNFIFIDIQKYILGKSAVGFDPKTNPLRSKPANNSKTLIFEKNQIYLPKKIQGDWLQLEYGEFGSIKKSWIKWKSNGKICIELFNMI